MEPLVLNWFELLDYASERGVSDHEYMQLADRFTVWMGLLCEPEASRAPVPRGRSFSKEFQPRWQA